MKNVLKKALVSGLFAAFAVSTLSPSLARAECLVEPLRQQIFKLEKTRAYQLSDEKGAKVAVGSVQRVKVANGFHEMSGGSFLTAQVTVEWRYSDGKKERNDLIFLYPADQAKCEVTTDDALGIDISVK